MLYEIIYPFPTFNSAVIAIWEWMSNFFNLHFAKHVNNFPPWDLNQSMLVKGAQMQCKGEYFC